MTSWSSPILYSLLTASYFSWRSCGLVTCWPRVHALKSLRTCVRRCGLRLGVVLRRLIRCWSSAGSLMTNLDHTVAYSLCGQDHGVTIYGCFGATAQSPGMLIAAGSSMTFLGLQELYPLLTSFLPPGVVLGSLKTCRSSAGSLMTS